MPKEVKIGDLVRITTKTATEQGTLMPSIDPQVLIIKVENGYNVGYPKKGTKIQIISSPPPTTSPKEQEPAKNPSLPTISILHTGGTIASKVDYRTGGVTTKFTPQELVTLFPELKTIANIESELIAQMWSDDLRFSHFALIAKKIEEHVKKGSQGIIIGMGTDNLAVAAAALSFIVESSSVPILLIGAQRSSDRGSSDAAINIISAARFITTTDFGGVGICMHEHSSDTSCLILPGAKTYKLHSSRRDAFKPINTTALAKVDMKTGNIQNIAKDYPKRAKTLILKPKMEDKVGLLKIHINMQPEQFSFYEGYKGLIIEGTGLGHTPGQVPNSLCAIHKKIYPALQKVIKSGCVIVMTTQCLFGSVNMNIYDKGRDLQEIGIIPGKDMLASTAFVKLAWLLGNYKKEEVKQLITQNLRGEMNPTISYEEEFV